MFRLLIAAFALALATGLSAADSGADYASLRPEQQRLVKELVDRIGRTVGKSLDPGTTYNLASESQRTTFDAVTHALLKTTLTDSSGKRIGTALELVEAVDEIAGEQPGESGDRQFRVYFFLQPDAFDKLERSQEFKRGGDNTVYHRGYPVCFRMDKVPSIQFSLSEDHKKADVDVDYRSSKFPKGLVNGHLTASNSDVRAGNNETKHNSRWDGLIAWWTSLFSLDRSDGKADAHSRSGKEPQKASGEIQEAVDEFFRLWLVDGEPYAAASYFSRDSYPCIAKSAASKDKTFERGMSRIYIARGMGLFNEKAKPGKPLNTYIEAPAVSNPHLKPVAKAAGRPYYLASAPQGWAEAFDCDGDPANNLGRGDVYVTGVSFPATSGGRVEYAMAWQKQGKLWRIVALYLLNADTRQRALRASTEAKPTEAKVVPVDGDPEFIEAATGFAEAWWVRRDPKETVSYLLPEAFGCLAPHAERSVPASPQARRRMLEDGIRNSVRDFNPAPRLEDALHAPPPAQDGVRVVRHTHDSALLLISVADQLAPVFQCGHKLSNAELKLKPGVERTYGNVYVSAFSAKTSGDPAVFYAAWRKSPSGWKIAFWQVETP